MRFVEPLREGRLIRRYKRFLADVDLGGESVTAHCPNTGSMLGCDAPGSRVWLSRDDNPKRKYPWTWELVEPRPGLMVGIHTGRANHLVREAIECGAIPELAGYTHIRREVAYGAENSRIDLLLESPGRPPCHVEVKNVTAAVAGVALFPDAVTVRGAKHLREMMALVRDGGRALLCFCVQREDADEVRPADQIDPAYGRLLREAMAGGVEVVAYRAAVSADAIELCRRILVVCP